MGTLAGVAYWPADTGEPVPERATADLLRQAAGEAGRGPPCHGTARAGLTRGGAAPYDP